MLTSKEVRFCLKITRKYWLSAYTGYVYPNDEAHARKRIWLNLDYWRYP